MFASFVEEAICQKQAKLLSSGAVAVKTGFYTGRAARARYIVEDRCTSSAIAWGETSRKFSEIRAREFFRDLDSRMSEVSSFDVRGFVGPFPVEIRTTSAWHAAFAETMFRKSILGALEYVTAQTFKIWHDPDLQAADFGMEGPEGAFVLIDPAHCSIGIIGTGYAGEIKKAAFSLASILLPEFKILPLHAAATCDENGEHACLMIGLSGTGKTTLALQPGGSRRLIGDDEIIWSRCGLSNLEGGTYAKLARLQSADEPLIWQAAHQFGCLLENVAIDEESRSADFHDLQMTENTRAAFPLTSLERVFNQRVESGAPENVVLLMADATGALPSVARLSPAQAAYHFLSGYTAKITGTETGIKEPSLTFSAMFGAPFMPQTPETYVRLFQQRLRESRPTLWLLNTGWFKGYRDGERFPMAVTRRLLELIESGSLASEAFYKHQVFDFEVPIKAEGLNSEFLRAPEGPQVLELAKAFWANEKKFSSTKAINILNNGGPRRREQTPLSRPRENRNAVFPMLGNPVVDDFK